MTVETFADELEREAGGPEKIEAVVIGGFGWSYGSLDDGPGDNSPYGITSERCIRQDKKGVPLSWSEARPLLDYDYDAGFGAPDCHAVYAWTADRVLFVSIYDGSTSVESVPRNPGPCKPSMPGGG